MKIVSTLLAGTALAFATGAVAQEQAAQAETMSDEMAAAEAPMAEAEAEAATEVETSFTDAEIKSFASAAIKLQAMEGDVASNPQEAAEIVAASGIDTDTFNAISQAMQTDPEVAERVQLAAAELQQTTG